MQAPGHNTVRSLLPWWGMNPYQRFVEETARVVREARALPLGSLAPAARPQTVPEAGCAIIFAPHPDDECLTGALALRLLRQASMRVIVVAVTLGSNAARRDARVSELRGACEFLGFQAHPVAGEIEELIAQQQPKLISFPHAADAHPTHMRAHAQVREALSRQPEQFSCLVALTEFWSPVESPNLMVESSVEQVADLVAATSFHAGEVSRNPYHLRLPAWMQDNVRRGSELIGGAGSAAAAFEFATLYRLERWRNGTLEPAFSGGRVLALSDDPAEL